MNRRVYKTLMNIVRMQFTKKDIFVELEKVVDPETDINVIDMGLIYDVVVDKNKIYIKMTLTNPACPMSGVILGSISEKIKDKFGVEPDIDLVFDPPWTPERMNKELKKKFFPD